MKHRGKALSAAAAMIAKAGVAVVFLAGFTSYFWPGGFLTPAIICTLGLVFLVFVLWFFRDPESRVPAGSDLVVAPAHGLVDVIDTITAPEPMSGSCRRISIFLSVFDVHVQQAPVGGEVLLVRHKPGQFLNAMKTESAELNENVLIVFQSNDPEGAVVGVRLIAGLIARRILPWVRLKESIAKGERISMIQFGSRVDLYLPTDAEVLVKVGTRVVGGTTAIAKIPAA
jgi:phosphatidylserine decarboxylase